MNRISVESFSMIDDYWQDVNRKWNCYAKYR